MPENQTSFYYDPLRQGYDANQWRTLLGAPVAGGVGRLETNHGAFVGYGDILKGEVTININVPDAPGGNDSRVFGLYQPLRGAFAVFTISDEFRASVSDGTTTTTSDALTWNNSLWSGNNVDFKIRWEAGLVKFYVSGTCVYTCSGTNIPAGPLSLYFFDDSGSAMTIGNIDVRGAQGYVMHLKTTDTTTFGGAIVMSQLVTVTDVPNIVIPVLLVPNVVDAATVTDTFGVPTIPACPLVYEEATVTEEVGTPKVNVTPSVYEESTVAEDVTAAIPE